MKTSFIFNSLKTDASGSTPRVIGTVYSLTPIQSEAAEPHAELRALYAQQVKDGTLGDFVWEYEHLHSYGKKPVLGVPMFGRENQYFCTPKPTCQVRNDDTGVTETMTQEAAQKLQAETKDVCDWLAPGNYECATFSLEFNATGIYTYRSKAKKLVNWVDMPAGVMTDRGEFRWEFQSSYGDNRSQAVIERLVEGRTARQQGIWYCSDLKLAPADQQNWLNWRGGDCPVPEGVMVEVTLRDNSVHSWLSARHYDWKHGCDTSDIIEYRVIGIADGWELK